MSNFDMPAWERLRAGTVCPLCQTGDVDAPLEPGLVGTLLSGRVILQDDAAFRGYCVLVYRRHATELFELSAPERGMLMEDISRVARVLSRLLAPGKINYAILGNEVPHLHVHVVPRYPDDGWWGRAIWLRPATERRSLPSEEFAALREQIRVALAAAAQPTGQDSRRELRD